MESQEYFPVFPVFLLATQYQTKLTSKSNIHINDDPPAPRSSIIQGAFTIFVGLNRRKAINEVSQVFIESLVLVPHLNEKQR